MFRQTKYRYDNKASISDRGLNPVSGGDPYWNNVELMLHGSGSNGGKLILDDSKNHFAMVTSSVAGVGTVTQNAKYGATCIYIPSSTGQFLETPDVSSNVWLDGDFTIEFSFLPASKASSGTLLRWNLADATNSGLRINFFSTTYRLYVSLGASSLSSTLVCVNSVWNHVAVTRRNSIVKLAINGVEDAGVLYSSMVIGGGAISIGKSSRTATDYVAGYYDEVRITKGVARYQGNFATSSGEFLNY